MAADCVEVVSLQKSFTLLRGAGLHRTRESVTAVGSISFSVPEGQAVALIGPNGAGKSTTIKMLTGILHPTSGSAVVLGLVPWQARSRLAHQIGAVFGQRSQLWYHLPPRDTFELLGRIYSLDQHSFRVRRDLLIDRFELEEFLDVPVRKLSLGQRMRAEIAASLLHRPRVIFLDEPTIGLDVIARQTIRDLIREWNEQDGVTVFLTSHDTGDIEHVARRVIIINHGRIVLDDKVSSLRRRYLGAKILDVRYHEQPLPLELPGVQVIKAKDYAIKLEVDTSVAPIEAVMQSVLRAGSVADIAIQDPPLEEVISHIYQQSEQERPK